MIVETLSVFPQVFEGPSSAVDTSIVGRARAQGILQLINHDLRDWTHDRHRTTDDQPFGGGQGLLMKVEPVFEALDDLLTTSLDGSNLKGTNNDGTNHDGTNLDGAIYDGQQSSPGGIEVPTTEALTSGVPTAEVPTADVLSADVHTEVVFLAPFGQRFDQSLAEQLAQLPRLILVCGRYEGFDERAYSRADRVISLGDFILTGGELAAMCIIDAICRLLPEALGDALSSVDESFQGGLLEYPQYTRPANYRGMRVPEVLLSGNHALIRQWRREQSIIKTAELRPELLATADLSEAEWEWLNSLS
ncbi:MAG: tRNA (guanosine(37)-N1)-methyltransferase TrmD [Coriobacteriales bacterium]|jgi:tRNA (guanine37-N1)-methyltransferase|nr:tRNA (guanosine(37)-N1)-methyltransferase TrmD [Coriobacteriales bacterium]